MAGETDGLEITVLARRLGELGAAGLAEQLRREGEQLLAEAVARSEAALRRDPGQLAAHLAGRLGGQLPARLFAGHAGAWLRPLSTSLEPPRSLLRATLQEHGAEVRAVLVMPDGQTLLSSAEDGRVLRWDLASMTLLGELVGHESTVNAMALTPAGDLLLTASDDFTIGLWDTAEWRLVDQLRGHTHYVRLALAGAAGLVVSASNDGTIRVWDLAERRELRVIAGHTSAITAMTLIDGGTRVAAASTKHLIAVWDLATGERVSTLFDGSADYRGEILGMTLAADNDSGVGHKSFPGSLQVWDVASRSRVAELKAEDKTSFGSLVLADAGQLAVTAGRGGQLVVVSLPDAAIVHAFSGAKRWVSRLVRLADDRVLAGSVEADRAVLRDVDVRRGVVLREVSVALDDGGREHELRTLAVSADGRRALIVADWSARLVDLESGESIARFVGDAKIVSGVIRPDGAGALVGEEGGRVHVLALEGA